jgi:6-pyruvoyltetrahydropterin/6-carboxytetrahydropterin synthase
MARESVILTRTYRFAAGHHLVNPALSHEENCVLYRQCVRPHGHNYSLEVTVAGRTDPVTGMAADLDHLDAVVERVVLDVVDHRDLNADVPALEGIITSGENLALTFWTWLENALPPGALRRVAVVETDNNVFECLDARANGDPE